MTTAGAGRPIIVRALRRRFVYPCADLVFQRPALDGALDQALRSMGVNRRRPRLTPPRPESTIAVLGFPRSGNTYLEGWLRWLALPETHVLDGRLTHSVLDADRLTRAGAAVLIPVRSPLQTCASWLVRSDAHNDLSAARHTLRAYTAWYTAASRLNRTDAYRVVRFQDFTHNPESILDWHRITPLLRERRHDDVGAFGASLHEELQDQPGQGRDLNGTPAHQMISVPTPARRTLLEEASLLLQDTRLSREREAAARAFARLEGLADAHAETDRYVS